MTEPQSQDTTPTVLDKIKQLITKSRTTNPHEIADQFLKAATHEDLVEFAEIEMPTFVSRVASNMGRQARHTPRPTPIAPVNSARALPTVREMIHAEWRKKILDGTVKVDDGHKRFGDCTADDFAYAAKIRFDHADAVRTEAGRFETLAWYMRDHGITKAEDLSDDVLAKYKDYGKSES